MSKQQTKEKTTTDNADIAKQQQAVAVLQPARLPYHPVYLERYGIDGMMWRALVEAVYPSAKTVEGIILAVSYCRSKNYDVMKKMVHVVPIWNSQLKKEVEGVWESVAALRATAFRTGEYAGCDITSFGPTKKFHFEDNVGWGEKSELVKVDVEAPEWAQVTVYRIIQGIRCAFPGPKVDYLGAYGCRGKSEIPNEKWADSGSYMLEKCAEAAALRKAFPEALGSMNAAEEMEGRRVEMPAGPTIEHEPVPPRPTREQAKAATEAARKAAYEMDKAYSQTMGGDTIDQETGEITNTNPEPDTVTPSSSESRPTSESLPAPTPGQAASPGQAKKDGPDRTGLTNSETPLAAAKEPDTAAATYQPLANDIIASISRAGNLSILNALMKDKRAEDFELLRTESPDLYKEVMGAVEQKKSWFAR